MKIHGNQKQARVQQKLLHFQQPENESNNRSKSKQAQKYWRQAEAQKIRQGNAEGGEGLSEPYSIEEQEQVNNGKMDKIKQKIRSIIKYRQQVFPNRQATEKEEEKKIQRQNKKINSSEYEFDCEIADQISYPNDGQHNSNHNQNQQEQLSSNLICLDYQNQLQMGDAAKQVCGRTERQVRNRVQEYVQVSNSQSVVDQGMEDNYQFCCQIGDQQQQSDNQLKRLAAAPPINNNMNSKSTTNRQTNKANKLNNINKPNTPTAHKSKVRTQNNITVNYEQLNTDKNMIQNANISNPNRLLHVFYVHNLLQLSSHIKFPQLQSYIWCMSKKYAIPYNKILIYFSVQYIIFMFYKTQHINCRLSDRYVASELQRLIPLFLTHVPIKFWQVFKKIIKVVWKRFGFEKMYRDVWLIGIVKKNKKWLRETGVQVDGLIEQAQAQDNKIITDINEQPNPSTLIHHIGQIKKYILINYPKLAGKIELMQPNEQLLQSSEKQGVQNTLPYYLLLQQKATLESKKQKIQAKAKNSYESNQGSRSRSNDGDWQNVVSQCGIEEKEDDVLSGVVGVDDQFQELSFQICAIKLNLPKTVMFLQGSTTNKNQNSNSQQIAEQQSQQEQQDERNESFDLSLVRLDSNEQKSEDLAAVHKKTKRIHKKRQSFHKKLCEQVIRCNRIIDMPNVVKNENKILQNLQNILYQFYLREPYFTMGRLEYEVYELLTTHFKVPQQNQKAVFQKWQHNFLEKAQNLFNTIN